MSLSQAVIPRVPRSLDKREDERRMTEEASHAMRIAKKRCHNVGTWAAYRITAAMVAGPALKGMAKGTMKGSSFDREMS